MTENLETRAERRRARGGTQWLKLAILTPLVYLVLSGTFKNPEIALAAPGLKAEKTPNGLTYFVKDPEYKMPENRGR